MDWNYYGVHAHSEEQSRQRGEVVSHGSGKVKERWISKRVTSTPLEEEKHPRDYATFGLSAVEKKYSNNNNIKPDTPINVYTRFCLNTAKSKFSLVSPVADW